mmetsp:Transcript_24272/g.52375  ORF Transcript_24272/g.52375 Transcript_24272/m.52375 type:complete len:255 (-) Transcript_24272:1133-1897(-)
MGWSVVSTHDLRTQRALQGLPEAAKDGTETDHTHHRLMITLRCLTHEPAAPILAARLEDAERPHDARSCQTPQTRDRHLRRTRSPPQKHGQFQIAWHCRARDSDNCHATCHPSRPAQPLVRPDRPTVGRARPTCPRVRRRCPEGCDGRYPTWRCRGRAAATARPCTRRTPYEGEARRHGHLSVTLMTLTLPLLPQGHPLSVTRTHPSHTLDGRRRGPCHSERVPRSQPGCPPHGGWQHLQPSHAAGGGRVGGPR